jgi:hypothetical protein
VYRWVGRRNGRSGLGHGSLSGQHAGGSTAAWGEHFGGHENRLARLQEALELTVQKEATENQFVLKETKKKTKKDRTKIDLKVGHDFISGMINRFIDAVKLLCEMKWMEVF